MSKESESIAQLIAEIKRLSQYEEPEGKNPHPVVDDQEASTIFDDVEDEEYDDGSFLDALVQPQTDGGPQPYDDTHGL